MELDRVVGHKTEMNKVAKWCLDIDTTEKKGLILCGRTGLGKEDIVRIVIEDYDFDLIEIDLINSNEIDNIKTSCMVSSVTGKKKLYLFNGIDMFKTKIRTINKLLEHTKNPMLFTLDSCTKIPPSLATRCVIVRLKSIRKPYVIKFLRGKFGEKYPKVQLEEYDMISDKSNGNLNSAILLFHKFIEGKELIVEEVRTQMTEQKIVVEIFTSLDREHLAESLLDSTIDITNLLTWLSENVPKFYNKDNSITVLQYISSLAINMYKYNRRYILTSLVYGIPTADRRRPLVFPYLFKAMGKRKKNEVEDRKKLEIIDGVGKKVSKTPKKKRVGKGKKKKPNGLKQRRLL